MEKLLKSVALLILLVSSFGISVNAQCTGGAAGATVTPTATYQTATIVQAYYLTFAATAGSYYTFTFCAGGGTTVGFDAELSIYDATTNTNYGYNDNYCGSDPQVTFLSPVTGNIKVLMLESRAVTGSCHASSDFTNKTIAYRIAVPPNDNICNATWMYSNRCSMNYTLYTNALSTTSPTTPAPGCGTFNGRDVWFKTVAPSSGYLNVGTQAGGITNGAMAAYRGTSCSAGLTLLGCDYDGAGNMPELNLSGLTPGDSIYIRVYSFNNTQAGTFGIGLQDPYPNYCMMGSAVELNNAGKCLRITPNTRSQLSAVWSTSQINMSLPFDYTYSVNLGNSDAGADGLTFTLQNNAAGTSAIGSPGYNLGIGPLTNTFIVEFDTYDNGAGQADIVADHIAINVNGNFAAPVAGPIQAAAGVNIEDGAYHNVRITWNPATDIFQVYFDNLVTPKLTYNNDIIASVFGGNPMVYWGVTGSTGSFTNEQSMCPGTLPGGSAPLPVTWSSFDAAFDGSGVDLTWSTHTEKNTSAFIIERSAEGGSFEPIGSIAAQGNSNSANYYSFIDRAPLTGTSYYRLKQTDINGDYSYSTIQSVSATSNALDLYRMYPNPVISGTDPVIELKEAAELSIYDNSNTLIYQGSFKEGKSTVQLSDKNIAAGIYYGVIRSVSSVQYSKILFSN